MIRTEKEKDYGERTDFSLMISTIQHVSTLQERTRKIAHTDDTQLSCLWALHNQDGPTDLYESFEGHVKERVL
jgi:hypothetical protein